VPNRRKKVWTSRTNSLLERGEMATAIELAPVHHVIVALDGAP
jgi:hypothetical protein